MTSLLSRLSIKSRIYFGFIVISCFIILISIISVQANHRTASNLEQYELSIKKASNILRIDNDVTKLQRRVQEYINTGYETVADNVLADIEDLKSSINEVRPLFLDDLTTKDHISRMDMHFEKYSQTLLYAVEEVRNKKQFLMNASQSLANVISSPTLPENYKYLLIKIENNLYAYLNDPNILLIDSSIDSLDQKINAARPGIKEKLLAFKKDYVDVVQSKRGYLYLNSVIMAGEASEFKYISTQLKDLVLEQTIPIQVNFENVISHTHTTLLVSSFILIILALILSYSISHSISQPLHKLTETFELLAENKNVENIPGLKLKDEIGVMSRAAEVFRVNNVKTTQLAKELDQEKLKLQRSNKELEQFAYITSHDLQEPLRTMNSFATLLNNQYNEILDQKGKNYLRFINEASNRMRLLIHGILEYSRIGKTVDSSTVNLNLLIKNVLSDLKATIEEKSAQIIVDQLPDVHGNELEYQSLYTNLISNALKFIKPNALPKIKIGYHKIDNKNIFYVKDNGIGIDTVHKEKVFMIFQRFQDRKDYPGSGIGLAHCKKIIESRNGNIWLESESNQGCTFYFTLES